MHHLNRCEGLHRGWASSSGQSPSPLIWTIALQRAVGGSFPKLALLQGADRPCRRRGRATRRAGTICGRRARWRRRPRWCGRTPQRCSHRQGRRILRPRGCVPGQGPSRTIHDFCVDLIVAPNEAISWSKLHRPRAPLGEHSTKPGSPRSLPWRPWRLGADRPGNLLTVPGRHNFLYSRQGRPAGGRRQRHASHRISGPYLNTAGQDRQAAECRSASGQRGVTS
jgi:hypothetical protein